MPAPKEPTVVPIKATDDDGTVCIITQERILTGELYCKCHHCSKVFKETAIKTWLQRQQQCPHCRVEMQIGTLETYRNGYPCEV